ncbi:MAG: TIGR03905 family TSCPD domain-containing protein [Angelakisella sp.]
MTFSYKPSGVCSKKIDITLENGIIKRVAFTGGCNGNLQGISKLVTGMTAQAAIDKLSGIRCGFKSTSCPDQLSKALLQALAKG